MDPAARSFPGEGSGPRSRRDASAHYAIPELDTPGQPMASPDPAAPRNRHAGEASEYYATPNLPGRPVASSDPAAPRNRRAGEASAHYASPDLDTPGRPVASPDPAAPRNRRAGEASAHYATPDPLTSRARRAGETSAHHATPDQDALGRRAAPSPDPAGRRAGETSAHYAPPDLESRRAAASPDPAGPRGRRAGEASAHHATPDLDVPGRRAVDPGEPRPRRAAGSPDPADVRTRRVAPAPDPADPRGRRAGEASAHLATPDVDGPARYPVDRAMPVDEAGLASGRYPVDHARQSGPPTAPPANRQPSGPPTPPPANRQPGQRSVGPISLPTEPGSDPRITPASVEPQERSRKPGVPPVPPPPPSRPDDDPISMTTEMEAIGEEVQKRRTIDHTLARFSAVHDELKAEEREKKAKRRKLLPWQADDELDRLDEMDAMHTMAAPIPVVDPIPEPEGDRPDDQSDDLTARGDTDRDDRDDDLGGDLGGDLDGGGPGSTRLQEKKQRRRKRSKLAGKVFAAVTAILVFVGTGAAWGFKLYLDSSTKDVDALDPNSTSIQDADAQLGDENFLLVGSDTRAGASAEEGVGDENAVGGARSDTVMIAHVPKNRKRVVVVSFPRDLEVTRPDCEGWDPKTGNYTGQQVSSERHVKINTAYQVGGPKCVTKMVQELSGLAINHFVGIDFHGFKDMVDAVDGVQVCVEEPMHDETLGTIVPEAGTAVTLKGDQALNFVRARKVAGDVTSDYGRIKRQQRFLSSLLRKAMSTEVLLSPGKLTDFVRAFSKSTFGDNIDTDQLMLLGQSMQGIEAGRVTFITVPTVGESNERGNEDLLVDDTNALFQAIRQDTPLPGEAPASGQTPQQGAQDGQQQASNLKQETPAPVDPSSIKIQVLNGGNDTPGIAGDTAEELTSLGYQVVRVDAAKENVDKTIIKYAKSREAQAQLLAASVPGAQLVEDPSMSGAIMLIIGPGFDGNVVAPDGSGAPPVKLPENLSTVNAGDVSCA